MRIEDVNGKKFISYSIFGVYLVTATGTKNPDISKEGTFRISKKKCFKKNLDPGQKIDFFLNKFLFQKNLKFEIDYAN
jgi:hypothetical protein